MKITQSEEVDAMPFHLGPWEIGLILVIILIVFGVGKLPRVGSALGQGIREFRKGQRGATKVAGKTATGQKRSS
jgi:sec-independent protein translocase protein TatA